MPFTDAPLHERLSFDVGEGQVRDGPRRYVILRTDVLMGAFDGLPSIAREAALEALGRSVARFGADSVHAYLDEVGPESLLRTMVEGSASLGWGCWEFQERDGGLELSVRNSPFAAGTQQRDAPACHAIAGMLQAVASALWSAQAQARETSCACQHRDGPPLCRFVAAPSP